MKKINLVLLILGFVVLALAFHFVPKAEATGKKWVTCYKYTGNHCSTQTFLNSCAPTWKKGECPKPSPTTTATASPDPTESPEPSEEPTPEPSSEPTATPFEHQACGRGCVVDDDCRRYDKNYICYKDKTCRVENNSEDPQCNPRDLKPESVMSVEELKSLPAGRK